MKMKDARTKLEELLNDGIKNREQLDEALPILTRLKSMTEVTGQTVRDCNKLIKAMSDACADYAIKHPTSFVDGLQTVDGVQVGDVLVGIASSGVHSNGFSLVRKIVQDGKHHYSDVIPEFGDRKLGEVLLTPTKIYVKQVLDVIRNCDVHGICHITGGGFDENIPRVLSEGQGIEINEGSWEILPVFRMLEKWGGVPHREMFNIFNMGIGMVIVLDGGEADKAISILESHGEKASVIGRITDKPGVDIIME